MKRSTLSRSCLVEYAFHLPLTPFVYQFSALAPILPTLSPPSDVRFNPTTIRELSHDTINGMTIVEIQPGMKQARTSPSFLPQHARKLFVTPSVP